MYLFAIEIGIFIAFIIVIYGLKINSKNNPKQVAWSFAVTLGMAAVQFVTEMIISMAAYIYYDNYSIAVTSNILMGATPMIAVFITMLLLVKIAGAKGKAGIILPFMAVLLIVSAFLSYIVISRRWNMQFDLNELSMYDMLLETEEERNLNFITNVRNFVNFIPGVSYAVSVIVCSFNRNKNKKEEQ